MHFRGHILLIFLSMPSLPLIQHSVFCNEQLHHQCSVQTSSGDVFFLAIYPYSNAGINFFAPFHFRGISSLLRKFPPLCRASILSFLQCLLLEVFSLHHRDRLSRSLRSRCLYAGRRNNCKQVALLLFPTLILHIGFDIV
jgi:hypothetical protein